MLRLCLNCLVTDTYGNTLPVMNFFFLRGYFSWSEMMNNLFSVVCKLLVFPSYKFQQFHQISMESEPLTNSKFLSLLHYAVQKLTCQVSALTLTLLSPLLYNDCYIALSTEP